MRTRWHDALITLQPGESLRIHRGVGSTVAVFRGQLWLTQDGDLRDLFLGNGDSFTLDVAAPALLQAMGPTQLTLAAPALTRVPAAAGRLAWLGAGVGRFLAGADTSGGPQVELWPAVGRAAC